MCCVGDGSIDDVSNEFDVLCDVNDFERFAVKAVEGLEFLSKEFKPDGSWVPVSSLIK